MIDHSEITKGARFNTESDEGCTVISSPNSEGWFKALNSGGHPMLYHIQEIFEFVPSTYDTWKDWENPFDGTGVKLIDYSS